MKPEKAFAVIAVGVAAVGLSGEASAAPAAQQSGGADFAPFPYVPVSESLGIEPESFAPADAVSFDWYGGISGEISPEAFSEIAIDPAPIPVPEYEPEIIPAPVTITPVAPALNLGGSGLDNLGAFLKVIRVGESTDNYYAKVGGGNFSSFVDHPFITGEFKGIRRADGRLTTAAGAYQIIKTTWLDIDGKKRFGSFDPAAQDAAAVFLIKRRGAYDDILNGRVSNAVAKLRNEWEFLVTSRWQGQAVARAYTNFGGSLA